MIYIYTIICTLSANTSNLKFKETDFNSLNEEHRKTIIDAFDILNYCEIEIYSRMVSLIGSNGTSKLMHLIYPELFIIWDSYIRGQKVKRLYDYVEPLLKKAGWQYKKYGPTGVGYFNFLCEMKEKFAAIIPDYEKQNAEKPITKAIDEFNYMGITKRIMSHDKKVQEDAMKNVE